MPIISESFFQDFELLKSKEVVLDLSTIGRSNECEFKLPVFGYLSDTSDLYRNDFTAPLLMLSNRYSSPALYLEQMQGDCSWLELAQLNDNTYGTYYPIASKPYWIGYKLQWHEVLNLHGAGCYRIRTEYTDTITAVINIEYSYKFDLKAYSEGFADKTIKLTYQINGGIIGNPNDDQNPIDYEGITWIREVRLPNSYAGFETSEYTREYVKYKNGGQVWTKDDQVENIVCQIGKIPYSLHRALKVTALQSDALWVSDYNRGNQVNYDHKRVIANSGYEPKWAKYATYAPVEIQLQPYFQNLERKRC